MGTEAQIRYYLVRPRAKHPSFVIVSYRLLSRTKKEYLDLNPALRASLSAINARFLAKDLTAADAETLLRDLIKEEYRRVGVRDMVLKQAVLSKTNQKLFKAYWEESYASRFLSDEKSMEYDLQKALKLIEPLALAAAQPPQILAQLKKSTKSVKEMRRAIDRLNQFMKFLGKKNLPKPPKAVRKIIYLTEPEFQQMLTSIEQPALRALAGTLFGAGLRLSEALALEPQDYLNGRLNIDKQLPLSGLKEPKRGKKGRSLVIPQYQKYVEEWVKVDDKPSYRFAAGTLKPKILRHSHAIYLLGQGASMTQVALNLRNRVDVCQEYYAGFAHTDETLEGLKKLL